MQKAPQLILNTQNNIYFVRIPEITYCKSENSYTTFYFLNGESIVVSKKIKDYEDLLSRYGFFRSHQSYLVNLNHLQKIDKANGFSIILTNDIHIPTSTRKKKELMQILKNDVRIQDKLGHIQV